jgi:hypothetical protein
MSIGPYGSGSFGTGIFSATPFYTGASLIDAVLRDTGHSNPTTETIKRAVVLDFLNNRYAFVSTLQHWGWLYQEVDTIFREPYSDGTINVTENSQSVVGVGTSWNANAANNNVLYVKSRGETYLISTIGSNAAMTIEGQYAGVTDTDLDYEILKPIYTMPSDLEHIQGIQVDGVGKMVPVGRQEFARLKQHQPGLTGAPRYFTEIARRNDNVRIIEVFPAPDKNYTARLFYGVNIQRLTDATSSLPLIPDRHRMVLYYGALSDMYSYLRDATMAERYGNEFQMALNNMRNDRQLTDSRIIFQQGRNYKQRSSGRRTRGYSYSASDLARED